MHPSCFSSHARRTAVIFLALGLPAATFAAPEVAGVGNFHKLNDHVYRGAQPTDEGFDNLAKLGIRVVIDLQEPDSRGAHEKAVVTKDGMKYVNIPMKGMHNLPVDGVTKALSLLDDTTVGPVFVHCHRGADRTGGVIACYRIEHDHWDNAKALSEARSLGMSWFQRAIQSSVRNFQPSLTVAAETPAAPAPVDLSLKTVR